MCSLRRYCKCSRTTPEPARSRACVRVRVVTPLAADDEQPSCDPCCRLDEMRIPCCSCVVRRVRGCVCVCIYA